MVYSQSIFASHIGNTTTTALESTYRIRKNINLKDIPLPLPPVLHYNSPLIN
jgi:hypothetical protein